MNPRWFRPWWLLVLIPIALGLARLRFNVEVLDLLPGDVPSVAGVKLYQQKFSNSRELVVTIQAPDRELATSAAQAIAEKLRADTNRVAEVIWQPPWLEHPEQTAELIAHLWLNQPPQEFAALAGRLAVTNLATVLAATREELATTLSPTEIARLSYDPFGLTRLRENVANAAHGFDQGDEMFASPDGKFRILFVKSRNELAGYRECSEWLAAVRTVATSVAGKDIELGFTGRPAFVSEISASMEHDIQFSVFGTAVLIAILFWLAHRRWKPMLWLLTLLALILGSTLALGGLLFGTINVVSMGFAAILLGLAVDYAVVHYQEALTHPDLTVPQIRRAIAPSIFWAAVTTIAAFLVLNFGGLPGLAQLGSLVAIGVTLAAFVMIFAFLPPLFPERMNPGSAGILPASSVPEPPETRRQDAGAPRTNPAVVLGLTALVVIGCAAVLLRGLPQLDASSKALQPRGSQAYAAIDQIKEHLNQKRDPLWLVFSGQNESEVAHRLDAVLPALRSAVSNGALASFTLPAELWPRPERQSVNRLIAATLLAQRTAFPAAAATAGFSEDALGLTHNLLDTWQRAVASTNVFWPTNPLCSWILEKLAVREATNCYAVGFLFPSTNGVNPAALRELEPQLPRDGVWLAGWELLGAAMLDVVRQNLWKLVLPLVVLVLLSLWLAFRRVTEVFLGLGVLLLSGLILLTAMRLAGWSWNLLNLMALPLILGTGVDYSLFMQLALRRHGGDLDVAHRSVGRALLLCGGTAIAGFGMLGLSSNAGMAGLGRVCAVGITANMLLAIYLLPRWWKALAGNVLESKLKKPSSLYSARLWSAGLFFARALPLPISQALARAAALGYWLLALHRREVVMQNLLPVLDGNHAAARRATRKLFEEFVLKLVDLWRYEAGIDVAGSNGDWRGWENFATPHARGKGVLLVTSHLGNWELGASFFVRHNVPLLILTQAEPDAELTRMRQVSRLQRGVETLVVGEDAFAFVEIIKRLQTGATVALLVDRPPPASAVNVELFGQPFPASIAAAELARASGCAIVPGVIVRQAHGYAATILPEIVYDRAAIGDRAARRRLTQEILRAFEPAIRQHVEQWFHFVPVWTTEEKHQTPNTKHQ
jgi:predicted exporter/lauroyl/myristoyl acyltransferase